MIEVDVVFKSKLSGTWMIETKSFNTKESALRFMYAMKNKNNIIDGYRSDDPYDSEWLNKRFKLWIKTYITTSND